MPRVFLLYFPIVNIFSFILWISVLGLSLSSLHLSIILLLSFLYIFSFFLSALFLSLRSLFLSIVILFLFLFAVT